jgi:hypothetical protein
MAACGGGCQILALAQWIAAGGSGKWWHWLAACGSCNMWRLLAAGLSGSQMAVEGVWQLVTLAGSWWLRLAPGDTGYW